ncbi:endonuclease/exonuclease/phosphatase family protein [Rhodovulum sp.]|uniref:endonuclease/exonuclease/phosphatase family protein n=1 Tax=Rhodovulum sp. TaxID=34009 RepID=UPI0017F2D0E1|nr:endonuclease/exonuclease/phosphatase family protein [Rhodovulum sp.]HDR29583.1 alpha-1,4 polygalactosaminidase [Rhodovulum sp.]
MTTFRIATFNAQNLIGPDQEYQRFERYSPEDYAAKRAWMADQLNRMDSDILAFQEIIDPEALREVIAEADARAPHRRPYAEADLAFAPNLADSGPGERRPGLAILSRFGFAGQPVSIQRLDPPLEIPFNHLGGGDAGRYVLNRLTRPILKVRVPVGSHVLTVFNLHLRSRMGEFVRPRGARFSPEVDLSHYDAAGRALGLLRASLRRMAEAWVLRKLVVDELEAGNPVAVLGDLNATPQSATQQIIAGERPFTDYTWLRRHDAKSADDHYSEAEAAAITEAVERVRLHSAERLFIRKSLRDMAYTNAFGGVFESFDAILLSRHFHPDWPGRIGEMTHFGVYNDHITDGTHPEAPGNIRASDHGQIMAHVRLV